MFWTDRFADEILEQKKEPYVIATGITPSGHIHVGNLREVLSAEGVCQALKVKGKNPRFIYIADDFDPLRRVYPFLSADFGRYVGMPLSKIPDPAGDCHQSYAEHFLSEFFESLDTLGIKIEKISATKMYEEGKYTEVIREALENSEKIKEILEKISGRKIPEGWSPFRVLCGECGRMTGATITELLLDQNQVKYECECGNSGNADFSKGEGKLLWRVDWAARWKMLGVNIEPYGKDHGTKGGSYDTAVAMSKDVFKYDSPYGFIYDFIYLKGKKGKMASSTGNVISASEILSVVPPEIIRYIILKSKPQQYIQFDPGEGLLQAVDEFVKLGEDYQKKKINKDQKRLYEISEIKEDKEKILVTFRHLVNVVQAAQGDLSEIVRILNRTGIKVNKEDRLLQEEISRVQKWIFEYAPENVKFEIQSEIPDKAKKLSRGQTELLEKIADELSKESDPEKLHNFIYETGKKLGLSPAETFKPIYLAILGKDYGPKAGWFLASLDREFVIKRLKEVSK